MFKNAQIRNILWMFIDKAFLLVGSFIISVMVARYLGPDSLGVISYALAISAILVSIGQWGANYTIFDTSIKNEVRSVSYIQSTELQRMAIYVLMSILAISVLFFVSQYDINRLNIVSLVIISQLFLAMDVYQFHFNAVLKSKFNAKSSILARLVSMTMRFIFVYYQFDFVYFVVPFFTEAVLIFFLRRNYLQKLKVRKKNIYAKSYFYIGTPLVITGVCVAIYTKMYEIILGNIISYAAVGLFNVAFVLSAAWTFVPMSIGISLMSKPIKEMSMDEKYKGFSFVTLVVLLSSVPMLTLAYSIPEFLIKITFGVQYIDAAKILFINSLACLFGIIGFLTNRMINSIDRGRAYLVRKVLISSALMLPVTFYLISSFSIVGASYAFLISELLNLTLFNYFFNKKMIFTVHRNIIFSMPYVNKYR
jgi:O-antigen/teichoic acid export membrane protein